MVAGDTPQVLSDRFIDFAGKLDDLSEPLGQIADTLLTDVSSQFASEGSTGVSGKWSPLAPEYAAWKNRNAPGAPILVGLRPVAKGSRSHPNSQETYTVSGKMRDSVLDPASMHVEPMRLIYSPTSNIAGFHQTGTSRMPARPIISLSPMELRAFDRYVVVYLDKLIKETGL